MLDVRIISDKKTDTLFTDKVAKERANNIKKSFEKEGFYIGEATQVVDKEGRVRNFWI